MDNNNTHARAPAQEPPSKPQSEYKYYLGPEMVVVGTIGPLMSGMICVASHNWGDTWDSTYTVGAPHMWSEVDEDYLKQARMLQVFIKAHKAYKPPPPVELTRHNEAMGRMNAARDSILAGYFK